MFVSKRMDRAQTKGFTLIQMSILVTILGLTLAATLPGGKEGSAIERQLSTEEKLDAIQRAMSGYRVANTRLPCPADGRLAPTDANFGIAAPDNGTCTGGSPAASLSGSTDVVGGMIPVRTLGLDDSYAVDGYGRRFTYVVDRRATSTSSCVELTSTTAAVQVKNAAGVITRSYGAFISHGASGYGAYPSSGASANTASGQIWPASGTSATALDADKRDNASFNATPAAAYDAVFVKKERSGTFDDLVRLEGSCCTGDSCTNPPYDGPDIVSVQYDLDAWNPLTKVAFMTYKDNGTTFAPITPYAGLGADLEQFAVWSPDNNYIIAKANVSGSYQAAVFKRNGDNFTRLAAGTIPSQPANNLAEVYWTHDSKFLILVYCCSGTHVRVYQRSGDTFTQYTGSSYFNSLSHFSTVTNSKEKNEMVLGSRRRLLTYDGTSFTSIGDIPIQFISPDGNWGLNYVGFNIGTFGDYQKVKVQFYRRGADNLKWNFVNEVQIDGTYLATPAFSPDGMYFVVPVSTGKIMFAVFKNSGNKLERIDAVDFFPRLNGGGRTDSASFSHDGKYLLIGSWDYNGASSSTYYYRKVGDMFYYQGALNNSPKSYAHTWMVHFRK